MASVWYIQLTKEIVDCDMQFNNAFVWGDADRETEKMDLQNIATHELGNFFNLTDIYDSAKSYLTMYGYRRKWHKVQNRANQADYFLCR